MALITVVEAAGLSGLSPERIQALIEGGRLPAQAVPLDHRSVYLIESAELESIAAHLPEPGAARTAACAERDPLVEALAGLRAALVRRRLVAETESDEEEASHPRRSAPRRSVSSRLPEPELRTLAARVDRLLRP